MEFWIQVAEILGGMSAAIGLMALGIGYWTSTTKQAYALQRDLEHLKRKYEQLSLNVIECDKKIDKLEDFAKVNRVLIHSTFIKNNEPFPNFSGLDP